ncbi:DDB1- and CUL4-associated factor 5-like [Diadema setosum]|uniref:DDB1- and CUL4-associated factor 5-like n=1 Tax=Diadema setosum TaxID=31175 RepID=UPI003B3AE0E6
MACIDGVATRTSSRTVHNLPVMLTNRQHSGNTRLPQLLMSRRIDSARKTPLYRMNLLGHYGCVNAIEFSNKGGQYLASGGDDRRVLLWNINKALDSRYEPNSMKGEHHSNIFCMAFDNENGKIFSGGNDDQVLVHDTRRGDAIDVFLHEDAVYGLAVDPRNDNIYASACADGRIQLWDIRAPSHQEPFVLANYVTAFHAVVYHPQEPRFLATANAKEGIALWDVRAPRSCLMKYGSAYTQMNAMSVRFNQLGTQLLALRRRLPAVLYDIHSPVPAVEFNHEGYYNSCTMKSCCFGGDRDQYVLSGSDDFNLYIWRVPDPSEEIQHVNEAHMVLRGHRQIVNQVRFSPGTFLIASSGVEKVIKLWSAIKMPGMSDGNESPRKMYTRQQYFNLMISSGSALSHDYSDKSKEEDPRMLAFFDSFIQREVDHSFSSDSSDDSALSPDSLYLHFVRDHSDANSSDADGPVMPSLLPPELGMESDSDSDLFRQGSSQGAVNKAMPKSQVEERLMSAGSDATGCSAGGKSVKKSKASASDAQDRCSTSQTSHVSDGSSRRERGRTRSRSTTDSSSSSDESEDFLVMRYRSRLLRRIMRQKSKKGKDLGVRGKSAGTVHSQAEKDRLASIQQRLAFSRVMKERITEGSESDSSLSEDNEQFLALVGQLRQRTDSARQRAASLRRHRILALEDVSSSFIPPVSGPYSPPSSRSTQRDSSTNSSTAMGRLASVASSHSSPSNSPRHVQNGFPEITVDTTNSAVQNRTSGAGSHAQRTAGQVQTAGTKSKSKSKIKHPDPKGHQGYPSTSNGSRSQPVRMSAACCSTDSGKGKHDAESTASNSTKDGAASKNGFKKFKVNSSGKKRHYRSTNCYSRHNDSDSD